jgi:protein-S-isoprenylcysteine O-methyltransferase Ste14
MQRPAAIAGSAFFLLLAPGTVAGWIPWLLCRWKIKPPLLGFYSLRWTGVLLIAAALPVLLDSFRRFAVEGLGTPAPVAPTEHLVVSGMYRYVRNPMYAAVVSLIFGQGLLFGSVHVLEYGLAVWLVMHLFVLGYEEPVLHARYGTEYDEFRAHVRRWIPRVRPWKGAR